MVGLSVAADERVLTGIRMVAVFAGARLSLAPLASLSDTAIAPNDSMLVLPPAVAVV